MQKGSESNSSVGLRLRTAATPTLADANLRYRKVLNRRGLTATPHEEMTRQAANRGLGAAELALGGLGTRTICFESSLVLEKIRVAARASDSGCRCWSQCRCWQTRACTKRPGELCQAGWRRAGTARLPVPVSGICRKTP